MEIEIEETQTEMETEMETAMETDTATTETGGKEGVYHQPWGRLANETTAVAVAMTPRRRQLRTFLK